MDMPLSLKNLQSNGTNFKSKGWLLIQLLLTGIAHYTKKTSTWSLLLSL